MTMRRVGRSSAVGCGVGVVLVALVMSVGEVPASVSSAVTDVLAGVGVASETGLPPGLEIAGCDDELAGPVCLVADRAARLVLWLPDGDDTGGSGETVVSALAGAKQRRLPGGVQVILSDVDPARPPLVVVRRGHRRWRFRPRLQMVKRHPDLQAAVARLKAGDAAAAGALVERAWEQLDDRQRSFAIALRAEVALARGEDANWFALRAEAAALAGRAGLLASAAKHHLTLAHGFMTRRHDLTAARLHLERAAALDLSGVTAVRVDMQRGYLAERTGALAAAAVAFSTAAERADRLDQGVDAWLARRKQAGVFAAIGRFEEALAAFRTLAAQAREMPSCDRAGFLSSVAWHELMAREAGTPAAIVGPVEDTITSMRDVISLYRTQCARGSEQLPNAYVNLALAHLQAGQIELSRKALDLARASQTPPRVIVELWRLDLEGRVALALREPAAARAAFRRLEALATETLADAARWRALVGRARAEAMEGHRSSAIALYQRAETLLEQQVHGVPLGEGVSDFLAARDVATGELMAMLVAGGRTAEAIAVARRGRARTLSDLRAEEPWQASRDEQRRAWESAAARFLAARDRLEKTVVRRWTLAGTDLARGQSAEPPHAHEASRAHAALAEALAVVSRAQRAANMPLASPGSGEVILGYHPMARAPNGRTSWMAYAVSANAVATARLGAIDVSAAKAEQAAQLLGPFDALIGKARRVRVLDYGPLVDVDFHALPYRGEALGVHRRIVYSLDLPPASSRLGPTVARSILVMGDPTGNLPAARREGEAVAAVLGQRRPGVVSLLGPQGEPGTNLRRLLPRADLFHYAGHGRFAAADGVGSALTLADGALLRLTDVLALAPSGVPRQVVLSGCETGRRGAKAGAGLGLAQAFVLVGSEEVVATARDVGDEVAGRLSIRMHEHARQTGDLAEALHLAQNQLSKEAPLADWAAFRVIVP